MAICCDPSFKANLMQLPAVPASEVSRVVLTNKVTGAEAGVIENKPGTAGSVQLYTYLLRLFKGEITRQAAHLGCAIFAENTEEAVQKPETHGNIQRLLQVIKTGETLVGVCEQ